MSFIFMTLAIALGIIFAVGGLVLMLIALIAVVRFFIIVSGKNRG